MEPPASAPPRPGGAARLLVAGDFHLGRAPSRVPSDPGLSVAAVVEALVGQALARHVDAVVLTGDLADAANKHVEAFGVLARALGRLSAAGVPVLAVAGNHDFDVTPAACAGLPGVRVLGTGERWESASVEVDGREALRVVGWSFAGPHARASPLATFPAAEAAAAGVPVVGVLHADLDAPGSAYAPVTTAELAAAPACAWLLGHVHAPRAARAGRALVLYPGSPQPLDPGEAGVHGAWLVTVTPEGSASAEKLPLATVHYASLDVDLGEAADAPAARQAALDALREHAADVAAALPTARCAVARLRLTGRTPAFAHLAALAAELTADAEVGFGALTVRVDRVAVDARPPLDLARLAEGSGPVATLAGLAARLDTPEALTSADRRLLARAEARLRALRAGKPAEPLHRADRLDAADVPADALARLRRQTLRLLDAALDSV